MTVFTALLIGITITILFLYLGQNSYSSFYLDPNSIYHNATGNSTVHFKYGVKCLEHGGSEYTVSFLSQNTLITQKQFSLKYGETLEESTKLDLPLTITQPVKISLILNNRKTNEEVHFWIND